MSELKPLSGHKFIRMMRPVLGLPENISQLRIEATADGIVYVDLTMLPNDTDAGEEDGISDAKNAG